MPRLRAHAIDPRFVDGVQVPEDSEWPVPPVPPRGADEPRNPQGDGRHSTMLPPRHPGPRRLRPVPGGRGSGSPGTGARRLGGLALGPLGWLGADQASASRRNRRWSASHTRQSRRRAIPTRSSGWPPGRSKSGGVPRPRGQGDGKTWLTSDRPGVGRRAPSTGTSRGGRPPARIGRGDTAPMPRTTCDHLSFATVGFLARAIANACSMSRDAFGLDRPGAQQASLASPPDPHEGGVGYPQVGVVEHGEAAAAVARVVARI